MTKTPTVYALGTYQESRIISADTGCDLAIAIGVEGAFLVAGHVAVVTQGGAGTRSGEEKGTANKRRRGNIAF